jgi:OOP family OmpA-OmpF porin
VRPTFSLVSDWAWKPIVLYDPAGGEVKALVRQQLVAHADAALLLWNCVRIDLNLPVALAQSGSDTQIRDRSYAAPHGGALGDLRLGVDVRIFGQAHGPITGAVGAQLFFPTGQTQAFSSDGGARFWPRLLVAGERGRFVWAASLGLHVRPQNKCGCDLSPGTEVTGVAAAGWRLSPRLLVGPELYGSAATSSGGPFSRAAPPVEALLGAHFAFAPRWTVNGGLAPGLTDGAGTPVLRAVVGVQYRAESLVRPQGPPPPAWPSAAPGP